VNVERSYHEEFQLNESKKGVNNKGRAVARQTST
jgi:hypothetical protein